MPGPHRLVGQSPFGDSPSSDPQGLTPQGSVPSTDPKLVPVDLDEPLVADAEVMRDLVQDDPPYLAA
jgi:hypothetical protein